MGDCFGRKFTAVIMAVSLCLACVPVLAFAYDNPTHFGNSKYAYFTDLTYRMQSAAGVQSSGWFDAYGFTCATNRPVGSGALECYTRLMNEANWDELNYGWARNEESFNAGQNLVAHTNFQRDGISRQYGVYSEHRVRNPITLGTHYYNTYIGIWTS